MNPATSGKKVAVGMSGGVDSSVAAALLKESGYEVFGIMLRLWSEEGMDNRCCTRDALADARYTAGRLNIPFYAIDAKKAFRNTVVEVFLDGYLQGVTPNPCLICNREIRWGYMLKRAAALGADYLATGHYARINRIQGKPVQLLRGVDRTKDQSYVLYSLDQSTLSQTLLPLGEFTKDQVRKLAADFNLPAAERPDSQDLCFIGNGDYRTFLSRKVPEVFNPGPILTPGGEHLGEHPGLAFFTIGQRKGLGISSVRPHYVMEKVLSANALIVGEKEQLGKSLFSAKRVNWIAGSPPAERFRAQVQIRYRAPEVTGEIILQEGNQVQVEFDHPLPDITPGQAAVFYQEQICLGGGIIK